MTRSRLLAIAALALHAAPLPLSAQRVELDAPAAASAVLQPDHGASVDIPSKTYNPPRYPSEAIRNRQQGLVWLKIEVDAAGRLLDVSVDDSSGNALLDQAAVDAAHHWRYRPAQKDGRPAPGNVRVPVDFSFDY